MADSSTNRNKSLAAIVGGTAATILLTLIPVFEGTVYKTYTDPAGVLTYCSGATEDAIYGKTYTPQECKAQLDKDLSTHAQGIVACIHSPMTDGEKIAFVDLAYNVGVSAFCKSTLAKKANIGDMMGACAELSKWVFADGKPLPGLIVRREKTRAICEGKS